MKQFKDIDPLSVAQHPNLIATLPDNKQPTKTFYFLLVDDHIIICNATYFTNKRTGKSKWLHYQLEFPKHGLRWFLDTLEDKFSKLRPKTVWLKVRLTAKVLWMESD